MENRIEINGIWYVREDVVEKEENFEDFELSFSLSAMYENEKYSWEAIRLYKDNSQTYFYDDIYIKFIDKRNTPHKEDLWDSNAWMLQVLKNDPDALKGARESMCEHGIKTFKLFLKKLQDECWLTSYVK
jgi:hypothetical protein